MTLITITPGPVLSVYRDGKLVIAVELSARETLALIQDAAKEIEL